MDPKHLVGQGCQKAGAILARCAMNEDRGLCLKQGFEIAPEQDGMPRLEGGLGVIVQKEGVDAGRGEICIPKKGKMGRFGAVTEVAVDHLP